MNLETVRLLFDFGLVVLIWLVQLIIYPGFLYYSMENLIAWHQKYTLGISLVVMPLMFGQLIASGLQLVQQFNYYTIGSLTLITLVWGITFSLFVPMHNNISKGCADKILLKKLIKRNWWRTMIWNLIFVYSLSRHFFKSNML